MIIEIENRGARALDTPFYLRKLLACMSFTFLILPEIRIAIFLIFSLNVCLEFG